MSGLLTKGAKLSVKASGDQAFVELTDLQSLSEFGGGNEKIQVTTLADNNHRYIHGLDDYGDLTATFLYSNTAGSSFRKLMTIGDTTSVNWKLELPDNTTFTFSGEVSVKINAIDVNQAMTFEASIAIDSDVTMTNPS